MQWFAPLHWVGTLGLHWWSAAVASGTALPSECMCIKKTRRGAMHGVRQARVKCVIDSKGFVATVSRHDCAHSCLTWLYADCGPSAGLGRQWSGCHLWQNSSQRLSAQVSLRRPAPLMLFCYPRLLSSYVMLLCVSGTHMLLCVSGTHMHVSHTYLVV